MKVRSETKCSQTKWRLVEEAKQQKGALFRALKRTHVRSCTGIFEVSDVFINLFFNAAVAKCSLAQRNPLGIRSKYLGGPQASHFSAEEERIDRLSTDSHGFLGNIDGLRYGLDRCPCTAVGGGRILRIPLGLGIRPHLEQ